LFFEVFFLLKIISKTDGHQLQKFCWINI